MVFFSKNRETALKRIKELSKKDKFYRGKTVRLAKKQIPHRSKWKTWVVVRKTKRKSFWEKLWE